MNEFEDCATQFKKDVIVNKDDTEEAIWNMACQTNLNIENGKGIKEALEDARKNIIDGMSENLISVSELCNADYQVNFNKETCTITDTLNNNNIVMEAPRNINNGMYIYEFNNNKTSSLMQYQLRISFANQAEAARFWSKVFGNPTDSTFLYALQHFKYLKIPNFNDKMLIKNPVHSIETIPL